MSYFALKVLPPIGKKKKYPELVLTVIHAEERKAPKNLSSYLLKIAKLGGYLARTSDPHPGNIVMWRGPDTIN